MRVFGFFLICLLAALPALHAQTSATGIPYFQQHVHYTLDATFLDDYVNPKLQGTGTLVYTNNSPDTLHDLYFHLYWNLFRRGSYGESSPNRDHSEDEHYGHGGVDITQLSVDGTSATPEIDNTIMRVRLTQPLLPGASTTVSYGWTGLLPNYGIRSTWGWHDKGARTFATAQWYPQVCVYDNHGWHPDQYIGMGEFYTDYGMFDVTLHLPDRFTAVVSTGWQTNQETLSAGVRDQLAFARSHPDSVVRIADHSNFEFQPITASEPLVTWQFHADSVRDFAWCADEGFIWDAVFDNGIMHHALYWGSSRDFWSKEAARIALLTIQTNSRFAGQYMYPNAYMCETYEGGMEYPGIVFIGPYSDGSYGHWAQNTMMHELGHEWYPMMMGSDETDYGWMDEGFNTFITTFVHERYFGRYNNSFGPGVGFNDDERTSNYRGALMQQLSGNQEPSTQKADMFRNYRNYAEATYPHPSAVFFMLRYTMGEHAFDDFMHLYYERWRFKHPYPDDLMNTAEDVERREGDTNRVRARGDLRWFFDEWFNKTWKLDYAVQKFDVDGNTANVVIRRNERAVMPLDLVFTFDDGSTEQRWIPVDDWLRTVADDRSYTYQFTRHPVHVAINPANDLLDINRLNNESGWLPPMQVELLPKIFGDIKPIDKYAVRSSPFIAPTSGNFSEGSGTGVVFGWTVLGSYLDRSDRLAAGIRLNSLDLHTNNIGEVLQYHTVADWISPYTDADLEALHADHNEFYGVRLSHTIYDYNTQSPLHIFNAGFDVSGPLLFKNAAAPYAPPLNRISGGYTFHKEAARNEFVFAGNVEAGLGDPRTSYSKLAGMIDDRLSIARDWDIFGRIFGGSMQPITGTIPPEAIFHIANSSAIDHFEDLYGSNFGTTIRAKIRNATLTGPLVRGYYVNDYTGRVAASGTLELSNNTLFPFTFLRSIPILGHIFHLFGFSIFGDAGLATNAFCTCRLKDETISDAGVGLRFNGAGGILERTLGLDLGRIEGRLDFPVWLSAPPSGQQHFAFRFVGVIRQNF